MTLINSITGYASWISLCQHACREEDLSYIAILYLRILTITIQPRKIIERMVYKVCILFSAHCSFVACPLSVGARQW